ncbi:MAG: hypothetical protein OIF57_05665 [Marinobacterium sp.]|nr:hypothetical protein [Marinobacterium sp.]
MGSVSAVSTLAAGLILAGISSSVIRGLGVELPGSLVGVFFWLAITLLWRRTAAKTRLLSSIMLTAGVISLGWGLLRDGSPDWMQMAGANTAIISMVVSVSFLSLVRLQKVGRELPLLSGQKGISSTLLGAHIFASVINLSAMFIFADRISQQGRLSRIQTLVLNRAMTLGAFWSPFYASMAVAVYFVPDAPLTQVLLYGLPLAITGLVFTLWELGRDREAAMFQGYPIRLASLWFPALMASLVLLIHELLPQLPVLVIITVLAPLLSLLIYLGFQRRSEQGARKVRNHIQQRLPQMCNEITLFLSAGLMTQGINTLVSTLHGWQLFDSFTTGAAVISLIAIMTASIAGIHPIIGISILASLVTVLPGQELLFALVLLACWSIGTSVGPLSGINLALHGRYGVDVYQVMRWNLPYAAVMTATVIIGLLMVGQIGG